VTTTRNATRIDKLDSGDWLEEVLVEARADIVTHTPRKRAINRMRRRLLAEISTPQRVAA
jgi:hypothetical protein